MDLSAKSIAIAAVFLVGGRLATLYLGRLDSKMEGEPEAKRRAIAASRRRAHGHLWLLGTVFAALFALMVALAQDGPSPLVRLALAAALAAAATLCAVRMIRAYGEARRVGKSDPHAETAA